MDQRQSRTAADIVNGYEEKELYRIIRDYGEDKFAKNIAKHIVAAKTAESDPHHRRADRDHSSVYSDEDAGNRRTSGEADVSGNSH